MSMVETGRDFKIENVLTLRKKMTQAELLQEMQNIGKFLEQNNIKKNGPIVTATFAVEQSSGQPLLDMEIMVPMDKPVELTGEYRLKEAFHLVNAVYARHKGDPNLLEDTYNRIAQYINEKKLQQITVAYNVNVVDLQPGQPMDDMIVDVYIGVNPSIL